MKKKRRISLLFIIGSALVIAGLIGLYSGPEVSQYVFLPGTGDYSELLARAEEKWADTFPALSLHGTVSEVSLTAGGKSQGEITLQETLGGYFEVYPRRFTAGRPLTRGDGRDRVIVLDAGLAFQFFGDQDPLGQEVTLGEKKYQVVGVAEYARGVGDAQAHMAWIPLGAGDAPKPEIMTLSAGGGAGASLRTIFETGAKEVFGEGQAIFLGKERTRGTVLLRFVIIVIALWLLARWIRIFADWTGRWIAELREKMKTRYPRQMMGSLLGRILEILLLTALTIAAAAALVVWTSQLMMVFPEWVPEALVDPDSIAQRFRELTSAAASPLKFTTPELSAIRFWSGLIRWGIVLALLGVALKKTRKPKDSEA